MNIEISKSMKKDKKRMAVIDGKRLYSLGRQRIPITKHTKTLIAKHDLLTGIRNTNTGEKTGVDIAGWMAKQCSGISQQ